MAELLPTSKVLDQLRSEGIDLPEYRLRSWIRTGDLIPPARIGDRLLWSEDDIARLRRCIALRHREGRVSRGLIHVSPVLGRVLSRLGVQPKKEGEA